MIPIKKTLILQFARIVRMIRYKSLLLCAILYQGVLAQENYCHDEEVNDYWGDLAIRAVDHTDVINLYKLRKELCDQIDTGEISIEDATNTFEHERKRVVDALERGKF